MSWSRIMSTGSGELRYMLVIEGWPEVWVTDKSITWQPDGQTVRVGLSCDGLAIRDRIIMYEARAEQDGITFKIRPTHRRSRGAAKWEDQPTASFSARATPVAAVAAGLELEDGATTFPALEGGGTLSNSTVYYMGSEAILIGTWPTITTRGYQSSIDQWHYAPATGSEDPRLYVWSRPPTMEGRRAYLYVWGSGDTVSAAGTVLWRGVVRRPPRLNRDGITWEISCGGIVEILKQRIAGDIKVAHPVGIYHHSSCAVRIRIAYSSVEGDPIMLVGWKADETAMMEWINDAIATELANLGADTFVESLKMMRDTDDNYRLEARTTASGQDVFAIELSSPIIGGTWSYGDQWVNASTGSRVDGVLTELGTSAQYYLAMERPHAEFFDPNKRSTATLPTPLDVVSPLGYAYTIMRLNPKFVGNNAFALGGTRWQTADASDIANNPAWRIYVDEDMDGVTSLAIPGTDKPSGIYTVRGGGNGTGYDAVADAYWVEVEPYFRPGAWPELGNADEGFMGFLTGDTEIKARRSYGSGTVFEFLITLKSLAIDFGNKGDTPFVTSEDLTVWGPNGANLTDIALRDYEFYGPVELDAMLLEELKLINFIERIDGDGKLDAIPLPPLTSTSPVDALHTIDSDDIVTPADSYGDWPGWEPERDGRVTTVKIQEEWDPYTDQWTDEPRIIVDELAVSISKTRGKAIAEIKPYSRRSSRASAQLAMSLTDERVTLGRRYLEMFAKDYDVVRLAVPFTKFDILCGEIVSVTHRNLPDGEGQRGLTGRRGIVIERSWPLDPKGDNHGYLTVMLAADAQVGYAPSALVTAQSNTTGTTWAITCSVAAPLNVAWSPNDDGLMLEHFADGDFIRLVKFDDAGAPTEITGVVSGTPNAAAGTVTVVLNATWTPGSDTWVLEFQEDTSGSLATDAQSNYAYVADSDLQLQDGSFARVFQ